MINCIKMGEFQKEIIDRALEFVILYAPDEPRIDSISFNNETKEVDIGFTGLYYDTLQIPYKFFEDEKEGLIKFVIKTNRLKKYEQNMALEIINKSKEDYRPLDYNRHLAS